MRALNDPKFKDDILLRLDKNPDTQITRIIRYLTIAGTIIFICLLLYWNDQDNIRYQIELKTTRETEHKLLNKRAMKNKTWVKVSEHEILNGGY